MSSSPAAEVSNPGYARLKAELLDAMARPSALEDDAAFSDLALRVFAFQWDFNAPYAAYCRASFGIGAPDAIDHWSRIPAVPADAFRFSGPSLYALPAGTVGHVFRTSGTTSSGQQRGQHAFPDLDLYRASVLEAWKSLELPSLPPLFLIPHPEKAPDSSLSAMMGFLGESLPPPMASPWLMDPKSGLDFSALERTIAALPPDRPVCLLGTALAFLAVLEQQQESESLSLPAGSSLFETGGYKGLRITLEKTQFYQRLTRTFAVPADDIVNEYSMTELSSQFFTRGLNHPHSGPPWTRIQVIDPESGAAAGDGQAGYLQVHDLANLASVAAVRTQDLAEPAPDRPHRSFQLLGRDPTALPRGCSRAADEILNPEPPRRS